MKTPYITKIIENVNNVGATMHEKITAKIQLTRSTINEYAGELTHMSGIKPSVDNTVALIPFCFSAALKP